MESELEAASHGKDAQEIEEIATTMRMPPGHKRQFLKTDNIETKS